MLVRSPPRNPGSLTGISSPSSWLVIPTTAMMASAFFAAAIASDGTPFIALAQISSACGALFLVPYEISSPTLCPFSRWTRPTPAASPRVPPPKAVATCLPLTISLPNPWQRMPRRKSPVSVGVRNPDHCTPKVFFPAISAGRLLSVSFTLASVRLTIGLVFAPGASCPLGIPSLYSAFSPGLPSGVVRTLSGTGLPSVRRNRVPGTKVMVAFGNSALSPSITETMCVGRPA